MLVKFYMSRVCQPLLWGWLGNNPIFNRDLPLSPLSVLQISKTEAELGHAMGLFLIMRKMQNQARQQTGSPFNYLFSCLQLTFIFLVFTAHIAQKGKRQMIIKTALDCFNHRNSNTRERKQVCQGELGVSNTLWPSATHVVSKELEVFRSSCSQQT